VGMANISGINSPSWPHYRSSGFALDLLYATLGQRLNETGGL
jgi:hypothetical protein